MRLDRFRRELAVLGTLLALVAVTGVVAPSFLAWSNLRDLAVAQAPLLIVAVGMTALLIARHVDVSVGSQMAVIGVLAGTLARAGWPMPLVAVTAVAAGALYGAVNGALVARLGLPSIVVTLATMVIGREGLRFVTDGADVTGLPDTFQWFGLPQPVGQAVVVGAALMVLALAALGLRHLAVGRALYAVGSDAQAAALLGLNPPRVTFGAFVLLGVLSGLGALLAAIRFPQVQTGAWLGFELEVIAAAVVGGTAVTGGRGTVIGTLLGVLLLGTLGTALTYVGIGAHWQKAVQGLVILLAVAAEAAASRRKVVHGLV